MVAAVTWWRRAIAWLGDALTAMAEDDRPPCGHRFVQPKLNFSDNSATLHCTQCGVITGRGTLESTAAGYVTRIIPTEELTDE